MAEAHGAREVARRVLLRVSEGAYATPALDGELRRAALSPRDRALCTELVYGTLRQRLRLDRALSAYAPRGLSKLDALTREVLRLGAYQLLFLRTPAHAAVDDAVSALRRARGARMGGFANALLRRLAREGEPPLPEDPADLARTLSLRLSLPTFVVADALDRFGQEEGQQFLCALNEPSPTWLRLNLLRSSRAEALAALSAEATIHPSPRLPEAVRVEGGDLFRSPAYAAGWFLAQDLGAQLVSRLALATPPPPGPILDACAGAGGKSTHLAMLTANQTDIDAADRSARKLDMAREHARRLGCTRVRTLCCDLTDEAAPLREGYALVLLDAPCSALGVLRRHPEARWREVGLAELLVLQARLLRALARRVVAGGLLVYAVCTYRDAEGPEQVTSFLSEHPEFTVKPPPAEGPLAGLVGTDGALRTWPHRDEADGFYAVRLQRGP